MNRVLITGTSSGAGKTTVTCALLSALCTSRSLDVTAFKCGPDYIDPMFHRETAGVRSYNLDPFFQNGAELREHLARHAGADISIIEGAMAYFDGIGGTDEGSGYAVAMATVTPAVLVVDTRGIGNSIAAVIEGFASHRKDSGIRGVIFNGASEARYPEMARIAREAGLKPLGYLPFDRQYSIGSRHLGLITAAEIEDIGMKLARLGETAERTLDIDGLLELASSAPPLELPARDRAKLPSTVRIAVARDRAFCFLYRENLELLEDYGAELVYFSPLEDSKLPDDIGAVYLCGGYPELHLECLSTNWQLLNELRGAIVGGLPTIAECGGFMLLHDKLGGYPMAGVIAGNAYSTEHLQRFGYVNLTAVEDSLLCKKGTVLKAHEFHYWDSDNAGESFTARKAGRGNKYGCAHASASMYSGFPHLYFTDDMARRFVESAISWRKIRDAELCQHFERFDESAGA